MVRVIWGTANVRYTTTEEIPVRRSACLTLLVSDKFEGDWPETVEICGTLPDGNSELQNTAVLSRQLP
jgi:hypothetical protein